MTTTDYCLIAALVLLSPVIALAAAYYFLAVYALSRSLCSTVSEAFFGGRKW